VEIRPLFLSLSPSLCLASPASLCHYHRPEETRRSTSFFFPLPYSDRKRCSVAVTYIHSV
jgi:hypothetical protein